MESRTISFPTFGQLHELAENFGQIEDVVFQERALYENSDPEYIDTEIDSKQQAEEMITSIKTCDRVGAAISSVSYKFEAGNDPLSANVGTDSGGRVNLKVASQTKDVLDIAKRDDETWDDCLQRLAQLDRATRVDQPIERE